MKPIRAWTPNEQETAKTYERDRILAEDQYASG